MNSGETWKYSFERPGFLSLVAFTVNPVSLAIKEISLECFFCLFFLPWCLHVKALFVSRKIDFLCHLGAELRLWNEQKSPGKTESSPGKFQPLWKPFCTWWMLAGPSHTLLQRGEAEKRKSYVGQHLPRVDFLVSRCPCGWPGSLLLACWSYHKACPCGPFTYLKTSWPVLQGSSPPTPTCVCRRHSSYAFADILCSDKTTFLTWPVQGWAVVPLGLVLSCAPSGKCALSLSFVLLIFSEFLLCTSPCAGLWRCNTETPSLFPHPQTIPFLPNQAKCVNEVLPLLS